MRNLLICSILAACSIGLCPGEARGDCVLESQATPASPCVVTSRDGRPGVWMDRVTAEAVTREHAAAPVVAQLLGQYREALALRDEQNAAWAQSDEAQARAIKIALDALQEAREAEARAAAWYRQPLPWAIAAGVVGVALGSFVTYQVVR